MSSNPINPPSHGKIDSLPSYLLRTEVRIEVKLIEQFYVFHLAASTDPAILNRLIKTASHNKETARQQVPLLFKPGEEELRNTLIKLEALQEIKEQQSLDNIPQTVLFMTVVEDESSSII